MGKRSVLRGYFYLLLIVMFFILNNASAISLAKITIDPASQVVKKGQEFSINISIDPANNPITAAQFNLIFNRSLIEVKKVTEGNLYRRNGANTIFNSGILNNNKGTLINVWGLIITPGANVMTKGNLATVTVYAKDAGVSLINLTNVIVSNPDSNAVQINITNGSIKISFNDTIPPASIKNLTNISYSQNYIKWIWTDPIDVDFSKVMIYLDGKFKTNVSKGVKFYNATGLLPNTSHTIAIRTVDTSGNINQTWVNRTAWTMRDNIPPRSITNLTNISYAKNYIRWIWTNPVDTDFSKVMIYLDGKFKTNVSRSIKYYNATGLIASTSHTIAIRTVDTSGNINRTWVNCTARTASR